MEPERHPYRKIASVGSSSKRPGSYGRDIDPIIGIDHFHIRAPTFAPHPHAGFSAVTYLFEDGEGEFINRDSLGDRIVAHPGAVIWTVTGGARVRREEGL